MQIEVCASSLSSVANAARAGANRVELCTELGLGGLTPSFGFVEKALELDLPLHILIRPRSGHFCYSNEEIEIMYADIEQCQQMGCAGVVVGALTEDYALNHTVLANMVRLSGSMEITFHRAFDLVKDPHQTLETLIDLGFNRILTSGQKKTALAGLPLLTQLLKESQNRIALMPGGGVTLENCLQFKEAGFQHLHFSGFRPTAKVSLPNHLRDDFSFLKQPFGHSDETVLKEIISSLRSSTI